MVQVRYVGTTESSAAAPLALASLPPSVRAAVDAREVSRGGRSTGCAASWEIRPSPAAAGLGFGALGDGAGLGFAVCRGEGEGLDSACAPARRLRGAGLE